MMRRAKVNYLDKEDMMGHKIGLESSYERYEEADFERFPEYQKAIPFLTISDEERIKTENKIKEEKIKQMESEKDVLIQQLEKEIKSREKIEGNAAKILKHLKLDAKN